MIKQVIQVFLSFALLTSCVHKPIKLVANQTLYEGVVIQSVRFMYKNQQHQWVCYSEISLQKITGLSCQNDTALSIFSGGLVDGEFIFEYPSRYLLKIKPHNLLAYIKMSLFNDLVFDQKSINIDKETTTYDQSRVTHIKDFQRNIEVTITTL